MNHRTLLSCLAVAFALIALAAVQDPSAYKIPIPERMERATVTDADGKLQWADLSKPDKEQQEKLRCPTCEGKKTQECPFCARLENIEKCPECKHPPADKEKPTTCRTCAGTGTLPDPLEKAPCPGCTGAGITRCHRCFGEGGFKASADDVRLSKCPVCKGEGHFACGVCEGQRLVEPPKFKPSLAEAELDDLKDALEQLATVEKEVAELASTGDARKDAKLWAPALKAGSKFFMPLRRLSKDFTDVTKELAKGAQAVAYAEMSQQSLDEKKRSLEYYLKHQRRILELCIERQEHNAKGGGD